MKDRQTCPDAAASRLARSSVHNGSTGLVAAEGN